jgi:hypothetical protein
MHGENILTVPSLTFATMTNRLAPNITAAATFNSTTENSSSSKKLDSLHLVNHTNNEANYSNINDHNDRKKKSANSNPYGAATDHSKPYR